MKEILSENKEVIKYQNQYLDIFLMLKDITTKKILVE